MPSWQGKSSGNKLGYSIFVTILQKFGLRPAYLLLRLVSFYYFLFARKSSRHILYYFRNRLGLSKRRSLRLLYKNYYSFGQSLIDKVAITSGMANQFSFHFDGEEHLHEMVKLGRGGLLLSAHIGNWEAAGFLLDRLNTNINIVMFDGEHRKIKQYLEKVTGTKKANVIVIKNDLSHIYAISEALSKNELICMHADRFIEGNKTISADFLGKPARFPVGPFMLAAQFKVPVCYAFAMKEGLFHYHFQSTSLLWYDYGDKAAAAQKMVNDFAGCMERTARQYPEQWYNYYDFWA
ncbi:MAG: lipid A biosynthesis acyltransferase [Chitinophagaceae bacterium]|nr:lipid A biosynthesis acyltransferase [Chitinophagaceae bacterium]